MAWHNRPFFSIYRNRKSHFRRIFQFWSDELPLLIYEARKDFRLSFLVFVIAVLIGAFSSAQDPEFVRIPLGDAYVEMTIENIESGDPMKVYKERGQFGMSLGITGNNLWVSFLTFTFGLFFGLGTILILIQNGIMLGAFQYFFIEKGLFWESFLTIWIHGTLEISAIIIAGAAGLTLGRGLAFPGTYTRMQSFQRAARRGIKIMMGIVPVIIMAGFIEGYLTRYTETPNSIRALFIIVCLLFVLIYFVWYPFIKAQTTSFNRIREERIPPTKNQEINFSGIKTNGEIFTDIFLFLQKHFRTFLFMAFVTTTAYCSFVFFLSGALPQEIFSLPSGALGSLSIIDQYFINKNIPYLLGLNTILFGYLHFQTNRLILKQANTPMVNPWLAILNSLIVSFILQLILLTQSWFTIPLLLIIAPIGYLWMLNLQRQDRNIFRGLQHTFPLLQKNVERTFGLILILTFLGAFFFTLVDSFFLWFFVEKISWVISLEQDAMNQLTVILSTFTTIFGFFLIYAVIILGFGFLYFTLLEITEANDLRKRILSIGLGKKIQGLDKE